MKSIELPVQVYSKNESKEKCPYDVLVCSPELKVYETIIRDKIKFQWNPGADKHPDVWYFLAIDHQYGLLCLFEDVVVHGDVRPHVLRRTVGLCEQSRHSNFLASIKECGCLTHEVKDDKWIITINAPLETTSPFHWITTYLIKGIPSTYAQFSSSTNSKKPHKVKNSMSSSKIFCFFLINILLLVAGFISGSYFNHSELTKDRDIWKKQAEDANLSIEKDRQLKIDSWKRLVNENLNNDYKKVTEGEELLNRLKDGAFSSQNSFVALEHDVRTYLSAGYALQKDIQKDIQKDLQKLLSEFAKSLRTSSNKNVDKIMSEIKSAFANRESEREATPKNER